MELYLPNSASLQNFGGFARKQNLDDPSRLRLSMHPTYVWVHPIALSMVAAAGHLVKRQGEGDIEVDRSGSVSSLRYLSRMGLAGTLGVDMGVEMVEHAPEGRFIPITQVSDQAGLNDFIVQMVPLLHARPADAGPIKYVITELVRNVLEHAVSPVGAMVCAQYFEATNRLSLGVADMGVGIRKSITRFHHAASDLDAVHLALRPGVTGATSHVGGNEQNAGAGLFFTKSIARVSRNYFVVYSGSGLFKLLKGPRNEQPRLFSDPASDSATRESDLPFWPGTAIGIDINVGAHEQFAQLLADIRRAYSLDVSDRRKARYRQPRFE
jgi:anti-sigma regulatory factor (Ser/Thr protein kinase)